MSPHLGCISHISRLYLAQARTEGGGTRRLITTCSQNRTCRAPRCSRYTNPPPVTPPTHHNSNSRSVSLTGARTVLQISRSRNVRHARYHTASLDRLSDLSRPFDGAARASGADTAPGKPQSYFFLIRCVADRVSATHCTRDVPQLTSNRFFCRNRSISPRATVC